MKISVITVCFNSASTIGCTLKAVSTQTHPYIEHIIVDGGSTDGTLDIIAAQGTHLARLVSEPDKGIYDAMNKGIALATGDVIGFLNADDFYASSDILTEVANAFLSSGADSCYGDLCYVSQEDVSKTVRYWRSCPFEPKLFEKGWCPPHPTFFVKRSVYQRLGSFDLSYKCAADVDLMARFLEAEHITSHHIPRILIKMRMGGASNNSIRNILLQNIEIRRTLLRIGLHFSLFRFLGTKLWVRIQQFISRPVEQ